jgi:hypothetical protein
MERGVEGKGWRESKRDSGRGERERDGREK